MTSERWVGEAATRKQADRRFRIRLWCSVGAASVTILLTSVVVSSGASAASDVTPPVLNVKPNATFVAGSSIGPMLPDEWGPVATHDILMRAQWTATDASGICGSSFERSLFDPGRTGVWSPWSSSSSVTTDTTDYDDQEGGGGGKFEGYTIRVRDCLDNMTEQFVNFYPIVWQEDGASYNWSTRAPDGSTTNHLPNQFSGKWSVSNCTCFSGGKTKWTTAKAASVTFTLNNRRARPVGLVMEKAPNRGQVQVLVDGVLRASPDTYSSTAAHRSVVWTGTSEVGVHRITVKNVATAGRSRIDVDAFLTSGSGYGGE